VRPIQHPLFRIRQSHAPQPIQGQRPGFCDRNLLVQPRRLHQLVADPVQRRERRHRLLENHADPPATDPAQLRDRHRQQILPAKQCPTALDHRRRTRQQPQQGQRRHRFSAPRLAYQPQHLAPLHLKRNPVNRAQKARGRIESDPQVFHIQQHLAHGPASSDSTRRLGKRFGYPKWMRSVRQIATRAMKARRGKRRFPKQPQGNGQPGHVHVPNLRGAKERGCSQEKSARCKLWSL